MSKAKALITADGIAEYLDISRTIATELAHLLPVFTIEGTKKHTYVTGTNYLDFVNSRIEKLTNGDFNSIKSLVQSNRKDELKNLPLYKKASSKCLTIAFNNLKGGVSKTTTVANLGAILAALNQKVLLVDMDMQNQLSTYFDTDVEFEVKEDIDLLSDEEIDTILDMIAKEKSAGKSILTVMQDYSEHKREVDFALVKKVTQTINFGLEGKTLDILPSEWKLGRGLETARSIPNVSILLKKILKQAKEEYDFILIDTSPSNMLSIELSFFASDYISLVSTPHKKSLQSLKHIIDEINYFQGDAIEWGLDIKIDSLILSRTSADKSSNSKKAWKKFHKRLKTKTDLNVYSIPENELFGAAETECKPLISYPKNRTVALDTISELGDYAIDLITREG
ncbi:MAG: 31 protein [Campylobacterota bacterium]|nr:31 protein [Campylobacterota bacterium]MDQ1340608.1 31 protein [Campylobacterota bacterium]